VKYYIRSGEFERVVNAPNPYEAAMIALTKARGEQLGHFFYIDERGFRGPQTTEKLDNIKVGETSDGRDIIADASASIDTECLPEFSIKYEDIIKE